MPENPPAGGRDEAGTAGRGGDRGSGSGRGRLTFGFESVDRALSDGLEDLVSLHWDEVALDKDAIPLDPDWDGYRADERKGIFHGIAARRDGRLIGYNCFWVMASRHYRTTLHALNDVLFIDPAERGRAGVRLILESERLLQGFAPTIKVIYHTKLHGALGRVGQLLERLGYTHIEQVHAKVLRGS